MVIWKDVPVLYKGKVTHIRKIGGRLRRSFIVDYGDVPVANFNEITGKVEEVINARGLAYAGRKRLRYRRRVK